jgi:hypothetical protein
MDKTVCTKLQTCHAYALKPGRDFMKVETPQNCSKRVPVRVVSVPWKLSTTEQHHIVICFKEEITETKDTTPKK